MDFRLGSGCHSVRVKMVSSAPSGAGDKLFMRENRLLYRRHCPFAHHAPLRCFDQQILNFDLQQIQWERADENLSDDPIPPNEQRSRQTYHPI